MMRRFSSGPWYPLLITLAFVLTAWSDTGVSVHVLARPLLIALGAVGILLLALRAARLSWPAASAVVIVVLVGLRTGSLIHFLALVVLLALIGSAVALTRRMWPGRLTAPRVHSFGNVFAGALVLLVIGQAAMEGAIGRIPSDLDHAADLDAETERLAGGDQPDVYLILLDGYPRLDTLDRLFAFDNAPFLDDLAERGFDVAPKSHSNYMYTPLTFVSLVQMEHINELKPIESKGQRRQLINHGPAWDHFESLGYSTVATAAPWEDVAIRSTDARCGDGPPTDFEMHLLRSTLMLPVALAIAPALQASRYREFVERAIGCVETAVEHGSAGPQMVMAHVASPHLPVVFDAQGHAADLRLYGDTVQELDVSYSEFAAAYAGQVQYLNSRVIDAVDAIIESRPESIIVITSDHGSESHMDWRDADGTDLTERFSTLFAARTPGHDDLFGDAPTPVNIFPTLLNAYFGTHLPLQPDTTYKSSPGSITELEQVDVPGL